MEFEEKGLPLPRYSQCFVCGNQNTAGLDITFYYYQGGIHARCKPSEQQIGYQGIVHGGILATMLDECMGWSTIMARKAMCLAAEISIRYKKRVEIGQTLHVQSELVQDKKRVFLVQGHIENVQGEIVCTGEGKFMPLPEEEHQKVIQYAGWGDAFDQVYETIQADQQLKR